MKDEGLTMDMLNVFAMSEVQRGMRLERDKEEARARQLVELADAGPKSGGRERAKKILGALSKLGRNTKRVPAPASGGFAFSKIDQQRPILISGPLFR